MKCDFCKVEVESSDVVTSEEIRVVDPMDQTAEIVLYPSFSGHQDCVDNFNTKRLEADI